MSVFDAIPKAYSLEGAGIREVAKRARVSIATVSRTINHNAAVTPALAKRVWKAVEELDFKPNPQARSLASGRSKMLGLIISEDTNASFPELVQEFEFGAAALGYDVLLGLTPAAVANGSPIRRMLQRRVDGILNLTSCVDGILEEGLRPHHVPLAFLEVAPDLPNVHLIRIDYSKGIRQVVHYLAALGHRRIAFISGPPDLASARERRDAFLSSMKELGIAVDLADIIEGDHALGGGVAAVVRMSQMGKMPTAIACSNDRTAIGVLHALSAIQLRVPDDVSVVGFDDIHCAKYMLPPLTSVTLSCREIAVVAVEALRASIEGNSSQVSRLCLSVSTRLVVRQSACSPNIQSRTL